MHAWGTDTLLVGTSGGGIHIVDRGGTSTALRLTGVNDLEGAGANLVNSFGRAMDQLLVCTAYGLAGWTFGVRYFGQRRLDGPVAQVRRASFTFAAW